MAEQWWLVERLGETAEPTSVAYEDRDGEWWEYEPATGFLHGTPWLATEHRYGSEYEELRFTPLAPAEARAWIAGGVGRRDNVNLVGSRKEDDRALNPADQLAPD